MMRLDRLIASMGAYSRNDVKKLIKAGLITVDGNKITSSGFLVDPEKSEVFVSGERFIYKKYTYIMLNKPKGTVSATEDKTHKTVIDLVPDELFVPGLFPAGRLDADTTGFVLLTNDGDFAHRILSPKNHVEKTYIAEHEKPLSDNDVKKLSEGVTLSDGFVCLPAKVKRLSDNNTEIIICEGKYHQIKRMFAAVDNRITGLMRVKIGGLPLDMALLPGKCREITQEELKVITT